MGMRIESFQVKDLKDLELPLKDTLERDEYASLSIQNGQARIDIMESYIKGRIVNMSFEVSDLAFYGEGSGTLISNYLEPILKKSTGHLRALLIWEGGELEILECTDGTIKYKEVQI